MKIIKEWATSINETRPLETIPQSELDSLLARFILGKILLSVYFIILN